ncbi:MAG TPA: tetraacyldisaccharide 4'-kinase [Bacteroidetes bacterium]|mgnify:CR=1 FL=1|nr:tetraacyldisaccharide 4'-kinase [Bacteroidota bacterium]HRK04906.1 tetraacyldisaccharide 4'-kinase [Chlorobiota bacterium]
MGLLARLYGYVVGRRNTAYDEHRRPIVPVQVPVVSIGNITTGGSGKTPCVDLVVRELQHAGRHPAIISRGYGRRSRGLVVVHDGTSIQTDVESAGDEPYLLADRLQVPTVVCSSKVDAAVHAAGHLNCDVIVVDDGFQHRALHRDIDIVLVDDFTVSTSLLPSGRLREPLTSLSRADVVLLTSTQDADNLTNVVRSYTSAEIYRTEITATSSDVVSENPVVLVSGIANPQRFVFSAASLGYVVADTMTFRDHQRYDRTTVEAIIRRCGGQSNIVVTTEKDFVKLSGHMDAFRAAGISVHVLRITMSIVDGADTFRKRLLKDITEYEDRHFESLG